MNVNQRKTSRLHKVLGVIGFVTFLGMYVVGPAVGWTPSKWGSVLLVISYMTLLGFGHIVALIAEVSP